MAKAALVLLLAVASVSAQEDCSRVGIVKAVSAIPDTAITNQAIAQLKLTSLLPDKAGMGTVFLPKDEAYTKLGVPPTDLLTTYANQTVAILAYHSLIGQGKTYSRSALVAAKTIPSDLSLIQGALGNSGNYDLTFEPSPGTSQGREIVRGVGLANAAVIRGVQKICGYYFYPIDSVLLPANALPGIPVGPGAALMEATAADTDLNRPAGLAAALAGATVVLPPAAIAAAAAASKADASAAAADAAAPGTASAVAPGAEGAALGPGGPGAAASPDSSLGAGTAAGIGNAGGPAGEAMAPAGAPGAANAPEAAVSAVDGVAGAALPLNGTDGTLSSTEPVLLQGNVTDKAGDVTLGPGLLYLDGAVQDGVGMDGTATVVDKLDSKGATLSNKSIPLKDATVSGAAFSAKGTKIREAKAMMPGGAQGPAAQGPGAEGPGAAAPDGAVMPAAGFGTALPTNADGTLTRKGLTLLVGSIEGGTALDKALATGEAKDGSLGPGSIYVDGEIKDGEGVKGKAYPIVSLGSKDFAVNQDNGIDIKGAKITGDAYDARGLKPKLQGAEAPGGAGAASAGSPGVTAPGERSTGGAASAPAGSPGSPPPAGSSATAVTVSLVAFVSTAATIFSMA